MLEGLRRGTDEASNRKAAVGEEVASLHGLAGTILKLNGSRKLNGFFWAGLAMLPADIVLLSPLGWFINKNNPLDLHTKRVFKGQIQEDGKSIPVTISSRFGNVKESEITIDVNEKAYRLKLIPSSSYPTAEVELRTPEDPLMRRWTQESVHTRPASIEELVMYRPFLESVYGNLLEPQR